MGHGVIDLELARAARRARPFPRPRFAPTVNGTVVLTLGTGDEEIETHLDVRAARALLSELADACDGAEFLARLAEEQA